MRVYLMSCSIRKTGTSNCRIGNWLQTILARSTCQLRVRSDSNGRVCIQSAFQDLARTADCLSLPIPHLLTFFFVVLPTRTALRLLLLILAPPLLVFLPTHTVLCFMPTPSRAQQARRDRGRSSVLPLILSCLLALLAFRALSSVHFVGLPIALKTWTTYRVLESLLTHLVTCCHFSTLTSSFTVIENRLSTTVSKRLDIEHWFLNSHQPKNPPHRVTNSIRSLRHVFAAVIAKRSLGTNSHLRASPPNPSIHIRHVIICGYVYSSLAARQT